MNSTEIFTLALGLKKPWQITDIKLLVGEDSVKELHLTIAFDRGTKFKDDLGNLCPVHDTSNKKWRHINFFEHKCFIHCKTPRIRTSTEKVCLIDVPWSRKNSGFTLLFEALMMALIEKEMPINKIGDLVKEVPHRLWVIFNYWIKKAYNKDDPSGLTQIGIDETSRRKGHNYLTVAVDLEQNRVVHVVEGKDKQTLADIRDYLCDKGTPIAQINQASIDLSPSFISGVQEYFPKAQITFDRFHVVKLLNKAMDNVRKQEYKEHQELKGHKYTFLKNRDKLTEKKQNELAGLIKLLPTLGEAYRLKMLFNDLWDMPDKKGAEEFIKQWFKEVQESKIQPFIQFAKTVKSHLSGIINFVESRLTNAILESTNNKIQHAKRRARGYRNTENFINMIYFLCGKLKFTYPLNSS